jgi:hypothetical protein
MSTRDEKQQAIDALAVALARYDKHHDMAWLQALWSNVLAAIAPPAPAVAITDAMVEAGTETLNRLEFACGGMVLPQSEAEQREAVKWIYRSMLAAAQAQPGGEAGE